jgi:sulfite oxidase
VRNHLPVPEVDSKTYRLEIEGVNVKGRILNLDEIKKKFPKVEISATIQCGGNRRSEMGTSKPVGGLAWSGGAIGNANWTGARLRDVLKAAGFSADNYRKPEKYHVQVFKYFLTLYII